MANGNNINPLNPSEGTLNQSWEDNYSSNYGGINPFQNWFSQYLGKDFDVYDSQSIMSSLAEKYGVEGLEEHMFPTLEPGLVKSAMPETYDAYKQMISQPNMQEYKQQIQASSGILNPNKQRQQAKNMWMSGMQDVNQYVTKRTNLASGQIRDWMKSALSKVMRMKY